MTDAEKRKFVAELYPGRRWRRLVEKMSGAQVFAIWKKEQEKLANRPKPEPEDKQDDIPF
jgi:aminoglycoside phosphotransferase